MFQIHTIRSIVDFIVVSSFNVTHKRTAIIINILYFLVLRQFDTKKMCCERFNEFIAAGNYLFLY